MPSRVEMLNENNEKIYGTHKDDAERLVKLGQAKRMPGGHQYRIVRWGVSRLPMRTRISHGGVRAAVGLSQNYEMRNQRGQVDSHVKIYPEDKGFFEMAVTDNVSTKTSLVVLLHTIVCAAVSVT